MITIYPDHPDSALGLRLRPENDLSTQMATSAASRRRLPPQPAQGRRNCCSLKLGEEGLWVLRTAF